MERSLLYRGLLILASLIIALVLVYPPDKKINLGLDLQGGMHLVLKVETNDAIRAETDNAADTVRRELESRAIPFSLERTGDSTFVLTGVPADKVSEVEDKIQEEYLPGWDMSSSGGRLSWSLLPAEETAVRRTAVTQAQQTIRNRIDEFGVAEAVVTDQGLNSDRIVIQLPGVDDPERVKGLIKSTAFLELRLVQQGTGPAGSRQELLDSLGGAAALVDIFPEDIRDKNSPAKRVIATQYWALEKERVITGRDLKTARPTAGEFGEPAVSFQLNRDGGVRFGDVTGRSIGRGLAIVLDGKVMSVANINDRITDSGQISGSFTQQEVQDLVTTLKSGALPAGLTMLEERTVGPSLGKDSIEAGWKSGLLGAILIVITMLVIYNLTGLNAVLALSLNILLIFAGLVMFGATLTLPGIAGIVLTIGMAVDANVLIFERIREELRDGRTVKSAIVAGFDKALSAITDGNLTALISAIFLFVFGTGPLRGFAVTLTIGITASIFTAIFVSRWIFDVVYGRRAKVEKISI